MAECAWSSVKQRGEKLLGLVEGQSETEQIGFAGVGVFFVARRVYNGELKEQIPRSSPGEKFLVRGLLTSEFDDVSLCAPANFDENRGRLRRTKQPAWVVVWKFSENRLEFGEISWEWVPGITVAVIDDRAGPEDLLDASGILANDGNDEIGELVELEGLFHDRPHAEVAGVFIGIADRDL